MASSKAQAQKRRRLVSKALSHLEALSEVYDGDVEDDVDEGGPNVGARANVEQREIVGDTDGPNVGNKWDHIDQRHHVASSVDGLDVEHPAAQQINVDFDENASVRESVDGDGGGLSEVEFDEDDPSFDFDFAFEEHTCEDGNGLFQSSLASCAVRRVPHSYVNELLRILKTMSEFFTE